MADVSLARSLRRLILFSSAVLLSFLGPVSWAGGPHCHATDQNAPISTDRTTFSNSSTVVPCGSLQIESGLLVSSVRKQRGYDAPESIIRFGASSNTELRFTAPDYFQNYSDNGNLVTGIGDLGAGVKQSLLATKSGFDLAAIAALTFPTGANAASSHGYDPTLQIMPSKALSEDLTLGGMFSVAWPTQERSRNVTGQASAQLDWQFRKPADAVVEYSGFFPSSGKPQHFLDFGGLYRPTLRQQIDVRAGVGLSAAATDHFFGVGYSVRFGL